MAESSSSKKGAAPAVPVRVQEDVKEETETKLVPSIHIIEASPEVHQEGTGSVIVEPPAPPPVPDDNNNKDFVGTQNNDIQGDVFSTPPPTTSEDTMGTLAPEEKGDRKVTFSASSPEIIKSQQSLSGGSSPRDGESASENSSVKAPGWGDEMATAEVLY